MLGGEMMHEMGAYFSNASSPSYFQKLFTPEVGLYLIVPVRLIALVGNLFSLPASSIPFFYTSSATLITAMMVGVFCLAQFRAVVKSDALRFFTAISVLIVADFATRTLINFSYYGVFFVAIITALALADDSEEVPRWAWFIPILMVSKPAILAVLPAMIIVAMVSKSRFRWITIAAVVLCILQVVQMIIAPKTGLFTNHYEISLLSKGISSVQYFFGLLGSFIVGITSRFFFHPNKYLLMLFGFFVFCASVIVIFKIKKRPGSLIIVGLSLLFFNVLLNCFAISEEWNMSGLQITQVTNSRHILAGFFGVILAIVGLIASLTDSFLPKSKSLAGINLGALIFIAWFVGSGWLPYGLVSSLERGFPRINNSQWQKMAVAIDSGVSPLCVPIDSFGVFYSRNCKLLKPISLKTKEGYIPPFEAVHSIDGLVTFEVTPPSSVSEQTLLSLAVPLKPYTSSQDRPFDPKAIKNLIADLPLSEKIHLLSASLSKLVASSQTTSVEVKAIINLKDGTTGYYSGKGDLPVSGGLIQLTGKDSFPIKDISSVRFIFSSPVEIALTTNEPKSMPEILWMGN